MNQSINVIHRTNAVTIIVRLELVRLMAILLDMIELTIHSEKRKKHKTED